jgi:hypothetical protein
MFTLFPYGQQKIRFTVTSIGNLQILSIDGFTIDKRNEIIIHDVNVENMSGEINLKHNNSPLQYPSAYEIKNNTLRIFPKTNLPWSFSSSRIVFAPIVLSYIRKIPSLPPPITPVVWKNKYLPFPTQQDTGDICKYACYTNTASLIKLTENGTLYIDDVISATNLKCAPFFISENIVYSITGGWLYNVTTQIAERNIIEFTIPNLVSGVVIKFGSMFYNGQFVSQISEMVLVPYADYLHPIIFNGNEVFLFYVDNISNPIQVFSDIVPSENVGIQLNGDLLKIHNTLYFQDGQGLRWGEIEKIPNLAIHPLKCYNIPMNKTALRNPAWVWSNVRPKSLVNIPGNFSPNEYLKTMFSLRYVDGDELVLIGRAHTGELRFPISIVEEETLTTRLSEVWGFRDGKYIHLLTLEEFQHYEGCEIRLETLCYRTSDNVPFEYLVSKTGQTIYGPFNDWWSFFASFEDEEGSPKYLDLLTGEISEFPLPESLLNTNDYEFLENYRIRDKQTNDVHDDSTFYKNILILNGQPYWYQQSFIPKLLEPITTTLYNKELSYRLISSAQPIANAFCDIEVFHWKTLGVRLTRQISGHIDIPNTLQYLPGSAYIFYHKTTFEFYRRGLGLSTVFEPTGRFVHVIPEIPHILPFNYTYARGYIIFNGNGNVIDVTDNSNQIFHEFLMDENGNLMDALTLSHYFGGNLIAIKIEPLTPNTLPYTVDTAPFYFYNISTGFVESMVDSNIVHFENSIEISETALTTNTHHFPHFTPRPVNMFQNVVVEKLFDEVQYASPICLAYSYLKFDPITKSVYWSGYKYLNNGTRVKSLMPFQTVYFDMVSQKFYTPSNVVEVFTETQSYHTQHLNYAITTVTDSDSHLFHVVSNS